MDVDTTERVGRYGAEDGPGDWMAGEDEALGAGEDAAGEVEVNDCAEESLPGVPLRELDNDDTELDPLRN